ncbi:MAG: TIGR03790 family protein [Verrucomicrobia bacterium]|nr:TIGR03790 family protein [Verrucomicrobiota bacterium]
MLFLFSLLGSISPVLSVRAQGPHECALIVNTRSPESMAVANHFIELRSIPPANVICLDIPENVVSLEDAISPEDFTQHIWNPVNEVLKERGIGDHILAWIYSSDIPTRVATEPVMSLQGITFARNQIPPSNQIKSGTCRSPFFAGPMRPDGVAALGRSLDRLYEQGVDDPPIPSMMLAQTGSRGLSVDESVEVLRRGVKADASFPAGKVAYVVNNDIRTTSRAWQISQARKELESLNVSSEVLDHRPEPGVKLIGLQSGGQWLHPKLTGPFRPGAIAEHLTSFGAAFYSWNQTKATEWLKAGATASAGTVTEPYAVWQKFPNARLFAHYARGCTVLESFYQSIACPLQILLIGDPLCAPWKQPFSVTLVPLSDEAGVVQFVSRTWAMSPGIRPQYSFFLDGRKIAGGQAAEIQVDTTKLPDGYHELRVVAQDVGLVGSRAHDVQDFEVENHRYAVKLTGVAAGGEVDLYHDLAVSVESEGEVTEVMLTCGERVIAGPAEGGEYTFSIDPRKLGEGPVCLQAVAVTERREPIKSAPVSIVIKRLNKPPSLSTLSAERKDGVTLVEAEVSDPESDPVGVTWFEKLGGSRAVRGSLVGEGKESVLSPDETGQFSLCLFDSGERNLDAVMCEFSISPDEEVDGRAKVAYLVFHYVSPDNFDYFGLNADRSAWVMGARRDGKDRNLVFRKVPTETSRTYHLLLKRAPMGNIEGYVDDELLLSCQMSAQIDLGPVGLSGRENTITFSGVAVTPPRVEKGEGALPESSWLLPDDRALMKKTLLLRLSDGRDGTVYREFRADKLLK